MRGVKLTKWTVANAMASTARPYNKKDVVHNTLSFRAHSVASIQEINPKKH